MSARLAAVWQRGAELAAAALLLAAPLALLLKTYDPGALRATVFELGALAAVAAWALKSLERGRFEFPDGADAWLGPAALLALWTAARWAFEPARAVGFPALVHALLAFGLFAVAGLELGGYRAVARLSGWALVAAWAAALAGAVQFASRPTPLVSSTFPEPRAFAAYLSLCLPLIAFKRLDPERDDWLKRADLALLALVCANVVWTGSAEGLAAFGLLALASAGAFAGFVPSRAARREALVLVGAAAATAACACLIPETFGRDALYQLEARRALWPSALLLASERPLAGFGPSLFETALSSRPPLALLAQTGAHGARLSAGSELLQLWGELGAVGLILAAGLLLGLWRAALAARRSFERSASVGELTALAGLFAAVFGLAAASLVGAASPRQLPWLCAPLAGALGGLTLLAPRRRVVRVIPLGLSPSAKRRVYVPAVAAALGLAIVPAQWLRSDLSLNEGAALARAERYQDAASAFARVAPLSPRYVESRYFLANALLEGGDPRGAVAAYGRLSALAPDYAQSNYLAALGHARLGEWAEAVARADRQSRVDPGFAPNQILLADAALKTGDLALARRAALTATALEPGDPLRWHALSRIYAQERKASEAADAARRARRLERRSRRPREG